MGAHAALFQVLALMPLSVSRHSLLLGIVAAAFFMQNLDSTVITTALPQMAITFATTPIHLSIGITAYILSLAVFIPVSGWIADRFGTQRVFCAAVLIFAAGFVIVNMLVDVLYNVIDPRTRPR